MNTVWFNQGGKKRRNVVQLHMLIHVWDHKKCSDVYYGLMDAPHMCMHVSAWMKRDMPEDVALAQVWCANLFEKIHSLESQLTKWYESLRAQSLVLSGESAVSSPPHIYVHKSTYACSTCKTLYCYIVMLGEPSVGVQSCVNVLYIYLLTQNWCYDLVSST